MSSGTTAEPIQPVAPVTNTRMRTSRWSTVLSTAGRWYWVMSVTVITVTPDVSCCHQLASGHESMGAERTGPARAGGTRALHRARGRTDHGGGARQPAA